MLGLCRNSKLLKSKDTELIAHLEKLGSSVAQHAEWVAECAKDLISTRKILLY